MIVSPKLSSSQLTRSSDAHFDLGYWAALDQVQIEEQTLIGIGGTQ